MLPKDCEIQISSTADEIEDEAGLLPEHCRLSGDGPKIVAGEFNDGAARGSLKNANRSAPS